MPCRGTPGPIGTFIDTNFQPISLVLVVVLLVVDFLIYYPFCKAYDNVLCKQEAETLAEEEAEETKAVKTAAAPPLRLLLSRPLLPLRPPQLRPP